MNWVKLWSVLGLMFALVAVLALAKMFPPRSSADAAAWTQAVLSAAAICVSGLVAVWVAHNDRRHQWRKANVSTYNAAFVALQYGRVVLEQCQRVTAENSWTTPVVEMNIRQIGSVRAMLERIPIADIPGEIAAGRVINCFRLLHTGEVVVELIRDCINDNRPVPQGCFDDLVRDYRGQVEEMETTGIAWLKQRYR